MLIKYNLETGDALYENLPKAGYGNQTPYQLSAFTDIDFAIDEEGLWVSVFLITTLKYKIKMKVIYSTFENTMDIVVSKLNADTLEVEATYRTNWRKKWSGNAFMACGVLYVLKKCDLKNTYLNYAYDTHTKQWHHIQVRFIKCYVI